MATSKPNILIIWGDDIGWFNVSAYNHGIMGYRTPNIDRLCKEGAMFTDWYGQQSCTAGRAAFITGQSPIRTGLTKVGLPGADRSTQKMVRALMTGFLLYTLTGDKTYRDFADPEAALARASAPSSSNWSNRAVPWPSRLPSACTRRRPSAMRCAAHRPPERSCSKS